MDRFTLTIFALIIKGSLYAQQLYTGASTSITITSGSNLAVLGNFENNGSITLKASTGSYAQLKVDGVYSGTGSVSQSQHLTPNWHLISSPVSDGFANSASNGDVSRLYAFNTAGASPAYALWSSSLNENNRGYYAKVDANGFLTSAGNFSITGALNTATTSRSLVQTAAVTTNGSANGSGLGWHLIGNPYTCGIDWFSWWNSTAGINAALYRWDPDLGGGAGAYVSATPTSTGTAIVPPLQGFWIQVSDANGATLPASTMASHGTLESATFYKQLPARLELRIEAVGDSARSDLLTLAHLQGSALAFEGATDAWKLSNGPGMPNLMARDDATGQETSINALDLGAPGVIPINFRCGTPSEKWRISAHGDWDGDVLLEDRLLGSFTDLRAGTHHFIHSGWTLDESRFRLHYVPAATLSGGEESAQPDLVAYASGEWLVVHTAKPASLYTLDGRLVAQSAGGSLVQQFPRPASGIYVVSCGTQHSKILVP
jgi:hypothetical protein